MKIDDPDFAKIVIEIEEQEKKLHAHPLFKVFDMLSLLSDSMNCFVGWFTLVSFVQSKRRRLVISLMDFCEPLDSQYCFSLVQSSNETDYYSLYQKKAQLTTEAQKLKLAMRDSQVLD